jgi:hypothetical protein
VISTFARPQTSRRQQPQPPRLRAAVSKPTTLNLRATVRPQTQHIADLEAGLSQLVGAQACSRTGRGAPRKHTGLEEQNQVLQNEIHELQAKLQD